MLLLAAFCCGVVVTLLVIVAASYLWPVEPTPASTEPRDPRAPAGMNEIEYRGWKERRDIADAYISRVGR